MPLIFDGLAHWIAATTVPFFLILMVTLARLLQKPDESPGSKRPRLIYNLVTMHDAALIAVTLDLVEFSTAILMLIDESSFQANQVTSLYISASLMIFHLLVLVLSPRIEQLISSKLSIPGYSGILGEFVLFYFKLAFIITNAFTLQVIRSGLLQ
jgi:hypothetical protein